MNKRKHLLAAGRLLLPTAGLSLICGGVFIKSIPSEQMQTLRDVVTYLFLIVGFILLTMGVLWAVSHGIQKVLYKQTRTRSRDPAIHVCTVDRPSLYPPSYEESQVSADDVRDVAVMPTGTRRPDLAPPVYVKICSDLFSEDPSLKQPPSYQQAVLQIQSESQAVLQSQSESQAVLQSQSESQAVLQSQS